MSRDPAGRFVKGESGNPRGTRKAATRKAATAAGVYGVATYGGYLITGERHPDLIGSQKWTTYSNAINKPVIATGLRYHGNLLAGVDWHVEPNEEGGKNAERAAEIVEQGLFKAPMLRPWSSVVRKASMYRAMGFSLHATAMRRRPDGVIVYSAIEHRPQFTIEQWLRKNERSPFHTVMQRSSETNDLYPIPLDECFYCYDDTLTDSPEGIGLLRHVIEYVRRLGLFEEWEGKAYSEDLAGVPIGRAPLGEIATAAGTDDPNSIKSTTDAATKVIRDFLEKRNKTPELSQFLLLDSALYANPDGALSGEKKWGVDLVKTETSNLEHVDTTIRRVELQIARVLGIEWTLMGADGAGSYAQHADKTSMFASNLQATLTEIGWFAETQLARRLVARNGLDPDTCTPHLAAEPISTEAVEIATRSLANMALAALLPDDPAIPVLRKRMNLPPPPERALELVTPRKPEPQPGGADQQVNEQPPKDEAPTDTAKRDALVLKMIRHEADGWCVYSQDGSKRLGGPYKSKQEALARLAEVEHYK